MERGSLVTVICLCYNHSSYVIDAIDSVLRQTYSNIELIVVDDGSEDDSQFVIRQKCDLTPEIRFIDLEANIGNCKAFNMALSYAHGEYIIDLAADDVLLPSRVEHGVKEFIQHDDTYGVNFTNAEIISSKGEYNKYFYPIDSQGRSLERISEGDVFLDLISRYYICPPSMMYKRDVLMKLGGYDENLTYEDFDFWVRSSRFYKYCYTDKVLVKKRILKNSKSSNQFKLLNKHTYSTFLVIEKALSLIKTTEEKQALLRRARYELRKAIQYLNLGTAIRYFDLLKRIKGFEKMA
ncbi:MAG: glycosyltransferase family A protein [Bacteroidota bacterium]